MNNFMNQLNNLIIKICLENKEQEFYMENLL